MWPVTLKTPAARLKTSKGSRISFTP
jgi:hypothetical protein